ncbi:MAG: response regulator [Gammaproteobacteria bacterium]
MKKCILFVDDESNVLQGLKRMLRSQRHEWDMEFADSGEAALALLQEQAFDAVISDMRMPGMDGAQLLEEVKQLYPDSVRFVLSGHSDRELVMRSVGPSHQYLAKPCDPEVLKSALTEAFALRRLLATDSLRALVAGMTSLPSLPSIYCEVVEELQSEDASIQELGKLIEQDPGMVAKVLQLVNSAYFGIGRQISNPAEAASFLGMDVLKCLVLSEGVFSQFDDVVVQAVPLEKMKNRSLVVANAAREIARSAGADAKILDQAYLGGLLHDMGTLVMISNAPDDYMRAIDLARKEQIDMLDAELEVFGTTHAEVGAYMLGLWGIDDDVVAAVAYHHRPGNFPATGFCALTAVYVANACVRDDLESGDEPVFSEGDMEFLAGMGLAERLPEWQALCVPPEEEDAA